MMSAGVVVDNFMRSLENRIEPSSENTISKGDVYIVLGGGLVENRRDTNYGATLSAESLKRLIFANLLYKENPLPIIVTGGKSRIKKNNFSEGFIMAQYLYDLGVKKADVIVESRSTNTKENAKYTGELLEKFGFRKAILIRSAYHMPRAVYAFKQQNIKVIPAPTDYHTEDIKASFIQFIPTADAMLNTCRVLHEYMGLIYYRINS
jgi:uncharacterized SAM-binding protein YcdF (DUF218 family)